MPTVDSPAILINGRAGRKLPALDRGLQLGDGLFETIAVRRGRPLLAPEHLDCLQDRPAPSARGVPDQLRDRPVAGDADR